MRYVRVPRPTRFIVDQLEAFPKKPGLLERSQILADGDAILYS
jgi:hypothetical protein